MLRNSTSFFLNPVVLIKFSDYVLLKVSITPKDKTKNTDEQKEESKETAPVLPTWKYPLLTLWCIAFKIL